MPKQKPGRSKQDYGTPRNFLDAVERHFGRIAIDLAAHAGNRVCEVYLGEGGITPDSLRTRWMCPEIMWLNPPFGDIEPWAMKCYETVLEAKALQLALGKILFLVPASIGSNWFAQYVYNCARVYALQGRLSFDGIAPYPKDCMLCVYGETPGFEVWDWRRS